MKYDWKKNDMKKKNPQFFQSIFKYLFYIPVNVSRLILDHACVILR